MKKSNMTAGFRDQPVFIKVKDKNGNKVDIKEDKAIKNK
jgi:hypothetical protein